MNITKEQLETLKGKCPECQPYYDAYEDSKRKKYKFDCLKCSGTGQAIIEIDKEWVECPKWNASHELPFFDCFVCKGKISKYKVGDEIEISKSNDFFEQWDYAIKHNKLDAIKLKIISETEDKYKVMMVK